MARLARFEEHRYVGTRDDMWYYDCDDPEQFSALESRVEDEGLTSRTMLSTFGPDEPAQARNLGFSPARITTR